MAVSSPVFALQILNGNYERMDNDEELRIGKIELTGGEIHFPAGGLTFKNADGNQRGGLDANGKLTLGSLAINDGESDVITLGNSGTLTVASTVTLDDEAAQTITKAAGGAGQDLTISLTGAYDASLILSSSGTGADALKLTCPSGTLLGISSKTQWVIGDDQSDAFVLEESPDGRVYLSVSTVDSSEAMQFGNATTNPTFTFTGTGLATFNGHVALKDGKELRFGNDEDGFIVWDNTAQSMQLDPGGGSLPFVYEYTAGATVAVNQAVYYDSGTSKVKLANAGAAGTKEVIGYALDAGNDNDNVRVGVGGVVTAIATEAINPGQQVFLSDTDGRLATSAGANEVIAGYAVTAAAGAGNTFQMTICRTI